jgi:hypothetical protein
VRTGRPPVPPEKRLSEVIHIRVTTADYDALCRSALKARAHLNEHVRDLLRRVMTAGVSVYK